MKKITVNVIGIALTILGIVLIIKGDLTNGLLAVIAGVISDIPKSQ